MCLGRGVGLRGALPLGQREGDPGWQGLWVVQVQGTEETEASLPHFAHAHREVNTEILSHCSSPTARLLVARCSPPRVSPFRGLAAFSRSSNLCFHVSLVEG